MAKDDRCGGTAHTEGERQVKRAWCVRLFASLFGLWILGGVASSTPERGLLEISRGASHSSTNVQQTQPTPQDFTTIDDVMA